MPKLQSKIDRSLQQQTALCTFADFQNLSRWRISKNGNYTRTVATDLGNYRVTIFERRGQLNYVYECLDDGDDSESVFSPEIFDSMETAMELLWDEIGG